MEKNSSKYLTVRNLKYLTPDSIEITLGIPQKFKNFFNFIPGQYLALEKEISGVPERRTYSISSAPSENEISVAVKKIPDGIFSNYAFYQLREGEQLKVFKPDGRFFTNYEDNQNLIFAACGSGITPIISIITFLLKTKKNMQITLLYGNKTIETTMYRSQLDSLKNSYMENLTLYYFFTEEKQDIDFNMGRINHEKVKILISGKQILSERINGVFLCGPEDMISEMRTVFTNFLDKDKPIISELFISKSENRPKEKKVKTSTKSQSIIKLKIDGAEKSISVAKQETILDAALRQNVDLPFSCKGGMCCTCRCLIQKGSVILEKNYSLEKWEQEKGFTLACQAKPTTNFVYLDFDSS